MTDKKKITLDDFQSAAPVPENGAGVIDINDFDDATPVVDGDIPTDEESVRKAKEDVYGVSYMPEDTAPEDNRIPSADNLPETLSYKEEEKETVPNYFGLFDKKEVVDIANKLGVSVGFFDKVGEAAAQAEYAPEKLYEAFEIKRKAEALKKHFPEVAAEADSILSDLVGTSPNKLEDISARLNSLEGSVASYVEEQPTWQYRGYINDTYDDPLSMATKRMIENTKNLKKAATEDATTAGRVIRGTGKGIQQYVEGFTKIVQEMASNRAVVEINDKLGKVANGEDVKFTDQERMFLQVMVDNAKIQDEYGKRVGISYKIGEAFGQSLGFMAEFVMTGGMASGATKLGQGAKVVSKAVQIGRATKVGKVATNMAIKAAQAGVQTLGMPSFYQKIAVGVSNGDTFGDALLDSYWQMWAENMSERIFMSKIVPGKEGANVLDRMLGRMGTTMTTEKGVLGVLKSTLEESAEEKIGEILTAPKDFDSFSEFWKSFTDVEQNKIMLGSVSLMTGMMGSPAVALNAYDKVSTGIKVDQLKSVLDADITGGIDKIYSEKDLTAKDAMSLVFDLLKGKIEQLPRDTNYPKVIHDALRYAQLKAKQTAMAGITEKEFKELISEREKPVTEPVEEAPELTEQQKQIDYLKSRGQVVPDGTDMETLNKMFSAEKTKERTELNTEIDTKVKAAQEKLGLPQTPDIEISEDTEATLERLDEGLPVTNEFIKTASDELYDRYKELEAMKTADTRLYTTEQIESMQGYLGEEIERLESYAIEQKETGKFVGEVESGKVAEGKAEGVAEGVSEVVGASEKPVEAVSKESGQVVPAEEKVAVKPSEEVFEPVEFERDLYQDKKVSEVGGKKYEFSRLNTKGEENVFLIEEEGAEIGRATLSQDGKYLENVRINEDKRRQGLGSRLYDYIEQQTGTKLEPSPVKQTKEAKAFWKKRKEGVEDAVQVEKAVSVPVQPAPGVGKEVEGRAPEAKPEEVAGEKKEVKKESDDKKRKRRLQRTDRQPAANGQPIVGKGETSTQGVRLVDGTIVKAGDEVVYKGETRKVKSVKGDVVTIPGVGDVHKSKVLAPTKPVVDTRGFNLEETNPNKVNDDLLSDEVFDKMRMNNIEPSDTDVLGTAALAKSLMNGDVTVEAAINEAVDRFAKRGTVPDHVPFFKAAPGAKQTSPYATYNDAVRGADNVGKNLWVRNTPFSTNKNRVLLVQFSSNFLYGKQPFKRDKNSSYFDKLYRLVAGYNRTVDFWEVPLWIARIAGLQRNADVYVVRDIEEAKKFINEAGYESVHFSALDVNEKHIVDIIGNTPGTKCQIGGYTDFKRIEAFPNVTVYKSIDEYVKNNKLVDIDGTYSYRHFKGTAVIPRLKLSDGCLYKCAFCSIPKKVIPVKKEWIDSQIESIKDLDATLVYLDDKTFGQAENYTLLPELYERIKEYNPDFKGFIVQTTALDFANKKRFSPEYLKNSHIQFVELGVETYNDDILTKLNKKHSHKKFVDAAMQNARDNNIKVIPNIIVGLSWNEGTKEKPDIKTETRETYQNTLDFLEDNKDIISHVNVYSLALYEGTELSDSIEVKEEADKNENIIAKSWQENKEDHEWAMDEFSDFASNQIQKKDEIQKEEKGLRDEKVNKRFRKISKQTGTDAKTVERMYNTLMDVFGLSQDKALAGAVIVDRMVGTMAKRTNKTKEQVYATIKWEKGGAIAEMAGVKQDVLGKARGAMMFMDDANAVIMALTDPNVTTPLHELAHVYEKYLTAKEKEQILKWTGEKSWSVNTSESFARGFERFLYDGTAPGNLKAIFQKFAAWLKDIYKTLVASEINIALNEDMRRIYSTMLGSEYVEEKVSTAAPETAEEAADAFFGSAPVDADGNIILSDEEIADEFFSGLEVDENGVIKFQFIGATGAARLDAAENNNNRIFNLREAMKMADANKTAEEIKLATGWEKGKDKRWRYEIPDNMKMRSAWDKLKVSDFNDKYELPITEAMDYPELFAAYPELEKIKIRKDTAFLDIFQSVQGWYDPVNMELIISPYATNPFNTVLHELQHAVQETEGFATGTNADEVIAAIPDFEFESVIGQLVEKLEGDVKRGIERNLKRSRVLSGLTSKEEEAIGRYSKEIIAARAEEDAIYNSEKKRFPDKNPYLENARIAELKNIKQGFRDKIGDIIERILGERDITLSTEFSYGIDAVEESIEATSERVIEDNKAVRAIKAGADRASIIKNFSPSLGDMAYNYYKRVAGETEARNVATRAKLTPEQRRSTAESTEDVPRAQQIVMRGGKVVSMDFGSTTVVVDGKKRPVLNSEGRPIHNTEEGIINFWKWFGESRVTDEHGRPLVVYHGTMFDFNTFNTKRRAGQAQLSRSLGAYFTTSPTEAQRYGHSVMPVYLSIKNPIDFTSIPEGSRIGKARASELIHKKGIKANFNQSNIYSNPYFSYSAIEGLDKSGFVQELKKKGLDGVLLNENIGGDGSAVTYIAFSPNQIKSATGNVGTFSPETGNILFQEPKTERQKGVELLANIGRKGIIRPAAEKLIRDWLATKNYKVDESIIKDALDSLNLPEREGTIKTKLGFTTDKIIAMFSNLYQANVAQVAVKELLQNSFDAVKANMKQTGNAEINIIVNADTRTIEIYDNGIGMTPEIVVNNFLNIGGSMKEGLAEGESSGGFGVAKVQFLMASSATHVETTRDGVTSTLDTNPAELYDGDITVNTEKTGRPNGTYIRLVIPEKKATGSEISFPGRYSYSPDGMERDINILTKPLIGDVEVRFTGIKNGQTYDTTLEIGANQDAYSLPPLFTRVKFDWGEAELYMSPEMVESPNHVVLSSGLYQFDHEFILRQWKRIPFNIVLNIKPKVQAGDERYPFENSRERFSGAVKKDIEKLTDYLRKHTSNEKEAEAVQRYSKFVPLPKRSPLKAFTAKQRKSILDYVAKMMGKDKSLKVPTEYVPTSISINSNGVFDNTTPEPKKIKTEKEYAESFDAERELGEVAPVETQFLDPEVPQFHNNTNKDYFEIDGAMEFFSDIGNLIHEFVRFAGDNFGWGYEKMTGRNEKYYAGISIDKGYAGVHLRKIVNAILINPLAWDFNTVEGAVGGTLHTFIHEAAHETQGGHDAHFASEVADIYAKIYESGQYPYYEKILRGLYNKHLETFKELRREYRKSDTENISESLPDESLARRNEGAVQADERNVSPGQYAEGEYSADRRGAEGTILFDQPLTKRQQAVMALANIAKGETSAEAARARIDAYLTSRGIKLGVDGGNIISEAIARLGLSDEVVEAPVRPAPTKKGTPSGRVVAERPLSGKVKESKLGIRVIDGESAMPQHIKNEIMAGNFHKYDVFPDEMADATAGELYRANGLDGAIAIYYNKENRLHAKLEVFLGAYIIEGINREISRAEKDGRIGDANYWATRMVNFTKDYIAIVSVERAQGLAALNSARVQSLFPSRAFLMKYEMAVSETRDKAMDTRTFKRKVKQIKNDGKKAHKEVLDDVLDDLSKKLGSIKEGASLREMMKQKKALLDELKARRKNPPKMQIPIPSIPGLDPVDVAYGASIASVYIQAGVYGEKLVKGLVKDFKSIGIDITEEQAEKMVPSIINVGGTEVSVDDFLDELEGEKEAMRLANRIFGAITPKKESKDPLTMMLNTLMAKFNERNLNKPERKKISDIEKIGEAIRDKEHYAETWAEARKIALDMIEANEEMDIDQKEIMSKMIDDAYDKATSFVFSEGQVDRAIRAKMKDMGMVLADIVRSHFDVQVRNRGSLTEAIIIDAGIDRADAEMLARAIERRYDSLMSEHGRRLIKKYTQHLTPTQKRSVGRRSNEERLLELINIGAFDDPSFVDAFASARGLVTLDPVHVRNIKAKAEEINKQKSRVLRLKKTEDLLGYMATLEGVSLAEIGDAVWYASVLSGMSTQVRNIMGGGAGVGVNLATEMLWHPSYVPAMLRGIWRGVKFGKEKAEDVLKYGYSPYETRVETPRVVERLKLNPKAFRIPAIAHVFNNLKYVSRFMAAADMFNVSVGKEAWAELLALEHLKLNDKKVSGLDYIFDSKYRKQVRSAINTFLGVTKEQIDAITAEVEADALELGYTETDKKIAIIEGIEMIRPGALVEVSTTMAVKSTGNTRTYGMIGFITDRLADVMKGVALPFPEKTKTGEIALGVIHPFKYVAAFTKIVSNVGALALEYVPFAAMPRYVSGAAGAAFKPGGSLSKIMPMYGKYYHELSETERKAVLHRQIVGMVFTAAMVMLSDPGDDDDPIIQITADGTGDWNKNNSLKDWKPYSLGIKVGDKRVWVPFRYTPLILALAPIGWARDRMKYSEKHKDAPLASMLTRGYTYMPSFLADMTAIQSMNEMLNNLFTSKFTAKIANVFEPEEGIERTQMDKFKSDISSILMDVLGSFRTTLEGFYTPGVYRDMVKIWENLTQKELEMPANELKKLWARNPISVLDRRPEGIVYRDVLGRPTTRPWFLSEFLSVTDKEDIMTYHTDNAEPLGGVDMKRSTLPIYEGGKLVIRKINPGDAKDAELWDYYVERRGYYLLRGTSISEEQLLGIEALKAHGVKGEEYQKAVTKLDGYAKKAAKEDVMWMSQFDLNYIRSQRGR